jgi:hypothetical protein
MHGRLSPATILAGLALFFALGGSALAVSHAVKPQARCANGAVRGIAAVTGDPNKGIANIPDQFSSSKALFSRAFNCAGGAVQVRRVDLGLYEIHFAGNAAQSALVSAANADSWVQMLPGGVFRVGIHIQGGQNFTDAPFVLVAV